MRRVVSRKCRVFTAVLTRRSSEGGGIADYFASVKILRKNEMLVTNAPLGCSDNRESGEELADNN